MIKYKCTSCGCCFKESEADTRSELVDSSPYYRHYESYVACPECGEDEVEEIDLRDRECLDYDEEFGCEGVCEDCPLLQGGEA